MRQNQRNQQHQQQIQLNQNQRSIIGQSRQSNSISSWMTSPPNIGSNRSVVGYQSRSPSTPSPESPLLPNRLNLLPRPADTPRSPRSPMSQVSLNIYFNLIYMYFISFFSYQVLDHNLKLVQELEVLICHYYHVQIQDYNLHQLKHIHK